MADISFASERGVARWSVPAPLHAVAPGLALTFAIAALATVAQRLLGIAVLSPLVLAMILGMVIRNTAGTAAAVQPGITFSLRRILRVGVILLGLQLTLTQVAAVGANGVLVIVTTLVATFLATKGLGRLLGVDRRLAELIAAGTAVCGASAVIAVNTVTRARDEDVAYAIAAVAVFGTLSMLLAPVVATLLAMGPQSYGLWVGASIHEVAQVVAAAFQMGDAAGQASTVAKLSRVMLLAPLILSLGFAAARRGGGQGAGRQPVPVPWFVLGFVGLVLLNSVLPEWPEFHANANVLTSFLLTMALAAMGLETDIRKLRAEGLKPLLLAAMAWVFVSVFALAMVAMTTGW